MITYFPSIYPDELLYSQLARYSHKSGYTAYLHVAEDLYVNSTATRPSIEFINEFKTDALQVILKNTTMENVIMEHTMFPYYCRFLNKERRQNAFDSLMHMNKNYFNLLSLPKDKKKTKRYLRYCPLCVEKDRDRYGETYWHRIHQINDIDICPIHNCYLNNSDVVISSDISSNLIAAEKVVDLNETVNYCNEILLCRVAKYLTDVFLSNIDMNSDVTIGKFLHSKIEYTKYSSARGERNNTKLLSDDFVDYYKNLSNNRIKESWQVSKILTDDRVNTYEICLLAMFLNISVDSLTSMKLPKISKRQAFDEKVLKLHKQGLSYLEISEILKCSYSTVVAIGGNRYKKPRKTKKYSPRSGIKKKDWEQIDNETLILVKETVKQLQEDNDIKPKKITWNLISKIIKIPNDRIKYLPKCKAEIEKYHEDYEEYWARVIVWTSKKLLKENQPFNWSHLVALANIKRENSIKCIPFLSKFADDDLIKLIVNTIKIEDDYRKKKDSF